MAYFSYFYLMMFLIFMAGIHVIAYKILYIPRLAILR